MKKLYTVAILACLCHTISGQEKKQTGITETGYVIPFQLTEHNNLSIRAVLNGKDTVNLMFHTAADAVTLTEEATRKLTSLNFSGADTVKSWGGGGNTSRTSKGNVLQIGEMAWEDVPVWEDKNSGQGTDGKFGTNLFENKVIEIDFDKKTITLHTSVPIRAKQYEKLKLIFENDFMFLESGCETGEKVLKNRFLLHSGYSGSVLLDDKFIGESKIGEELKTVSEKELQDSFGNVLKVKRAILPALILGDERLLNVPVGFFAGAIGRQKMSVFGGDILKRFNMIIDAKREYIYLKKNTWKESVWYE